MSEQFPQQRRLKQSAQFDYVFADPIKSVDAYFVVLARRRPADGHGLRLGLAISRKCARRAVARNRLKRLAREAFRRDHRPWQQLDADVVVIGRHQAPLADRATLAASFHHHWQVLGQRLCAP